MADVYYLVNPGPIADRHPSVTRVRGGWGLYLDFAYTGKTPGNRIGPDGVRIADGDQFFTSDAPMQAALSAATLDTTAGAVPVFLVQPTPPSNAGWFDLDDYLGLP